VGDDRVSSNRACFKLPAAFTDKTLSSAFLSFA
jgi:hypothetical protein